MGRDWRETKGWLGLGFFIGAILFALAMLIGWLAVYNEDVSMADKRRVVYAAWEAEFSGAPERVAMPDVCGGATVAEEHETWCAARVAVDILTLPADAFPSPLEWYDIVSSDSVDISTFGSFGLLYELYDLDVDVLRFIQETKTRSVFSSIKSGKPAPQVTYPNAWAYAQWIFGIAWVLFSLPVAIVFSIDSIAQGQSQFSEHKRWGFWMLFVAALPGFVTTLALELAYWLAVFVFVMVLTGVLRMGLLVHERVMQNPVVMEHVLKGRRANAEQEIRHSMERHGDSRSAFVAYFNTRKVEQKEKGINRRIENLRETLSQLGAKLEKHQREYAEAKRELAEYQENRASLEREVGERIAHEFDQLLQIDTVRALSFDAPRLHVFTEPLCVEYLGGRYELGPFRISLDLESNRFGVANLASTHPKGWHHPYGDEGVNFCFGALYERVCTSLEKELYFVAVTSILQAVQSVEGDATRKPVTQWRRVS